MTQITLTLDLTRETLDALRILTDALNKKPGGKSEPEYEQTTFKDAPAPIEEKKPAAKKKTAEEKKPEEPGAPEISLTDVRAVALKLSKAGKQAALKEIFAKYNAEKLSDISADNYPALMADLEAANE